MLDVPLGSRFGKWTTIGSVFRKKMGGAGYPVTHVRCKCDCGTEQDVGTTYLRHGETTHCRACSPGGTEWNPNRSHKRPGRPGIRKAKQEWLRLEKDNQSCLDCGNKFPWWVMQFDHVRDTKEFEINHSSVTRGYSLDRLKQERAKCDLVCANCHADRTHRRHYEV